MAASVAAAHSSVAVGVGDGLGPSVTSAVGLAVAVTAAIGLPVAVAIAAGGAAHADSRSATIVTRASRFIAVSSIAPRYRTRLRSRADASNGLTRVCSLRDQDRA